VRIMNGVSDPRKKNPPPRRRGPARRPSANSALDQLGLLVHSSRQVPDGQNPLPDSGRPSLSPLDAAYNVARFLCGMPTRPRYAYGSFLEPIGASRISRGDARRLGLHDCRKSYHRLR